MDSAPTPIELPSTWRWSVRTSTVRETTDVLSGLWGRASLAGVAAEDVPPGVRAPIGAATGAAEEEDGTLRIRTRTSVLTLVVVAPRPETVERAAAVVTTLASRHPSRAIIVSPRDPDGKADFDAQVFASCQLPERGSTEICTEEVIVQLGGELARHLAGTVAPLLIHDLPAVLWWPDDVPFGRPDFTELAEACDRLFVDSGQFRGDGLAGLRGLADAVEDGLVVHDVSWMRLMLWRELLASCFDHPLLRPELRSLSRIRVDVARPGVGVRLSRAMLFVGWLMSMLRLPANEPLRPGSGESWTCQLRQGRRVVEVEIRPVEVEFSGAVRSSGSLVRVELEATREGARTQVRVTRQADHLLATADWNHAPVTRRATRLEPFEETPYLAESLDRTGHDRIYVRALQRAVTLLGDADPAPGGARP